jgi:hypothetical protein
MSGQEARPVHVAVAYGPTCISVSGSPGPVPEEEAKQFTRVLLTSHPEHCICGYFYVK